jgi:hypothetical protein
MTFVDVQLDLDLNPLFLSQILSTVCLSLTEPMEYQRSDYIGQDLGLCDWEEHQGHVFRCEPSRARSTYFSGIEMILPVQDGVYQAGACNIIQITDHNFHYDFN